MRTKVTLSSCEDYGIDTCLDKQAFDLEYVTDTVLLTDDRIKLHDFFPSSEHYCQIGVFQMNYKILLHAWIGSHGRIIRHDRRI